jgi:hypothetical protein
VQGPVVDGGASAEGAHTARTANIAP